MNISIIDDHKIFSDLLKFSLSKIGFIREINLYSDPEKFFAHQQVLHTDVLITDMLMPGITGLEIIKLCRKTKSKKQLKIIVLSSVIDVFKIKQAFDYGANGYLSKDASKAELVEAIESVAADEKALYLGEGLKNILVEYQLFERNKIQLSEKQIDLLKRICGGKTVKEIAHEMDLDTSTVQSCLKQVMRKLGVSRTPELILKAIRLGLILPNEIH